MSRYPPPHVGGHNIFNYMTIRTFQAVLLTSLLAIMAASAQTSLVPTNAVWKYLDDGSDQGVAWRTGSFIDSSWSNGVPQLGYGDGDETTVVGFGPDLNNKYITTYFRHTFNVPNASALTNLLIRLLRDDGAVVYINDNEVLRDNMPAGQILFSTLASTTVEDATVFAIPSPSLLVNGANVIAVEIHQSVTNSTDISFGFELIANYSPVPPTATLLSPANAQTIAGTTVTIQANAADTDGNVTNASFFVNASKVGEDTTAPYSLVLFNVTPGSYSIFAEATDFTGLKGRSSTNTITVTAPPQGTLIAFGATWKYLATNQASAPTSDWVQAGYSDSTWLEGAAELGYGDGDEATQIPCGLATCPVGSATAGKWITSYYRKKFIVANPNAYTSLSVSMVHDDGAVVYLNGQELYRVNMPLGSVSWGTLASGALTEPYPADERTLDPSVLIAGENTIAVEMHQSADTSSDISFALQLVGQVPPSVTIVSPTNNSSFTVPFSFNLAADASDPDGSVTVVEFFAGTSLLGVATNAPYSIMVNSLPEGPHQLTAKATDNSGLFAISAPINITVTDPNPPSLLAATATTNKVTVTFSKAVVNPSATALANYSISPALQILSAAYGLNSNTVVLTTAYVQPATAYILTVNNVQDRAGRVIAANSQISFEVVGFLAQDIGNPAVAGNLTPVVGGYDYSGGGTNIGGTSDQFAFAYSERTSDFDFQVRVQSLSFSDLWAKAGLMARETLTANSRYAAVIATPSLAGAFFQSRTTTGGATVNSGSFPANYPNMYLRLKRVGAVFTGYASWDGQLWTQIGSATLAGAPNTIYLGMALVSSSTQPVNAQFRDLQDAVGGTFGAFAAPIEPPGPSTRRTGLVITEINYKPAPRFDGRILDFIELYNSNPYWEDISGYRISGEADYVFPQGTIMQGGSYLVVAAAPDDIIAEYGISNVTGPYTNALPTSGTIRLRNKQDAVLLEVPYSNEPPWPVAADGTGHSLVLAKPSYGERNAAAWAISDRVGGSPGRQDGYTADALHNVVINEFLANSPDPIVDYVELYNHSRQPVNIGGCVLTDDKNINKFIIPSNTVIAANGFVVFDQDALEFGLNSGGETIYLKAPDGMRILDAIMFEAQGTGISFGRHPDGGPDLYALRNRTPGARNGAILINDVVINEIMYDPISRDNDDEYVELFNKGNAPVDLSFWRFTAGISFLFPTNTVLGSSNYLVVSRNTARLMSNYANLNPTNLIGNYGGSLANSGERLALARPDTSITTNDLGEVSTNLVYVVVDEVTYGTGGHWGKWHNEGGSSLELIDPNSDHRMAYNWTDSDETQKAPWTTVTATGAMEQGVGTANFIELLTLGEGEYLVDNVEVLNSSLANMLTAANSSFDSGMGNWAGRGTHVRSQWDADEGIGGTGCLNVRASARGDSMGNRALCTITIPNGTVTLRAQVRWLKGWPEFLLRLHGNHFETFSGLNIPANLGTPGARNSRAVNNAGPAIANVVHSPVLPGDNEPVVVTARISDMDGVASATLFYRIDPGTTYLSVPMGDSGIAGDLIAGDGIYSATIPGQAGGTMVAFYVRATDERGASTTLPRDASPTGFECLVRFGETYLTSSFGTYRQWFTQNNVNTWINRPALSNEKIFGTFIYGNVRVIYNHSAKYSSSPYHQGQHTSPITGSVHYAMDMPPDDQCLGTDNWNKVHAPGNSAFDENTNQREQIGYWLARQMGLPWNYRRFVHMFVNGTKKGTAAQIMEDTERGGDDFVDSRFPDDRDGSLYKMQPWFEVDDGTALTLGFANQNWCTLNRYVTGTNASVHFPPRYRNNWLVRAANGTANDFSPVFNLIEAANTPTNGWTAYTAAMEGLADIEEWTRIFAVCHAVGDWDHFGTQNAQNMYGYKPQNSKWALMIWDFNILMGNSGSWGPGQNLFVINGADNRMPWIYNNPKFRRMLLRGLKEMAEVHMQANSVEPVIDARQNALVASGVPVPIGNVNTLKTWIRDARNEIARIVNLEDTTTFSVSGPTTINTTSNLVVLSGQAPVRAHTIKVNGTAYDVTWTTVRNWTMRLAVDQPSTVLDIRAYDINGQPLAGMTASLTVNYAGPTPAAEQSLVINEIMYNPITPESSFVEIYNRSPSFAFNLSGWRINGIDFTFRGGSIISPGEFMVIGKNSGAINASYGAGVTVFDVFDGQLDNGGETISLIKPSGNPNSDADDIVIDKVKYDDFAPWPRTADGGGPSLQLLDAEEDNARVSNWSDGSGWRYITFTGTNQGSATISQRGTNFFMFLNSVGEVFIDDMKLVVGDVPEVGENLLVNGDFETPLGTTWTAVGNHSGTAASTVNSHSGIGSLRLVSTGTGSTSGHYLRQFIAGSPTNRVVTLSFWLLPSTNGNTMTIRTAPGSQFNKGDFSIRPVLATPGAPNALTEDLPPYPLLWINEVQAVNPSGARDNVGEAEPWIELYNSGTTAINLEGYYLSDNFNLLSKWAFPAGSSINPGEYKLIWADNELGESTLAHIHTSIALSAPTGAVALARSLGNEMQIVDYVKYGGQQAGRSYGDFPDGQPFQDQVFFQPTPGASNTAGGTFVFINEWMASNTRTIRDPADLQFQDWIELYNGGSEPADISGFTMSDSLLTPQEYEFPEGTMIPAGGFLLIWADSEGNQENPGQLHASFRLDNGGDEINLFSPAGALLDRVDFNTHRQTNDISMGRFPDATGPLVFMTNATPRAANIYITGGANRPVTMQPISDKYVVLGETLSFTIIASDPDTGQTLTYSGSGLPSGATVGLSSGLFQWTPTPAQAPSTTPVTVTVTDSGSPPLSASRGFTIYVLLPPQAGINRETGGIKLAIPTVPGRQYQILFKNGLEEATWTPLGGPQIATGTSLEVSDTFAAETQRFYKIEVVAQ
jgi:lamin tail-like protein/CotH protein/Big-like domain-containing protein